jgi:hypothetical protein
MPAMPFASRSGLVPSRQARHIPYPAPDIRYRARLCALALALLLGATPRAYADTVRVITERALVWTSPRGVSVVVTQLNKDAIVEVVQKVGDWYEIVLPRSVASPQSRTGYIRVSQVVVETVGPPSAQAARVTPASAPRSPRRRPAIVNIDGGYRLGRDDLTRSATAFKDVLAEEGTIVTNYGDNTGWAVNFIVGQAVRGPIGVGVGAEYYLRDRSAAIAARIPNPFFFNQLRSATFDTPSLRGYEAAIHIPLMWMPPAFGSIKILAFGGPSIFRESQTVVINLTLNDPYPHDTVAISGVTTEERKGTVVGYHAGADVSYFFDRSVGVGVGARYSRATIKFGNDAGAITSGIAGAVEAVAGLRFRF